MQPCTVALFHVSAVNSGGSLLTAPCSWSCYCFWHISTLQPIVCKALLPLRIQCQHCGRAVEKAQNNHNQKRIMAAWTIWIVPTNIINLLRGNSHLWCVLGTRYEIPETGMEPRNKLIISFFSRQHSDTYDKISWANSLPKSKLAIHSVTTVTWISEHRHSSQTVEPWKTHSGVESITN